MYFSGYFGGYIVTIHKKECIRPSSMMYCMSFAFYLVNGFIWCYFRAFYFLLAKLSLRKQLLLIMLFSRNGL